MRKLGKNGPLVNWFQASWKYIRCIPYAVRGTLKKKLASFYCQPERDQVWEWRRRGEKCSMAVSGRFIHNVMVVLARDTKSSCFYEIFANEIISAVCYLELLKIPLARQSKVRNMVALRQGETSSPCFNYSLNWAKQYLTLASTRSSLRSIGMITRLSIS